ncbi:MAG: glycosyltransferase family 9 protein [Negativicutes bacterium]|nr:glycosyltransferase family 9 protein [Negativicutes bacterium]
MNDASGTTSQNLAIISQHGLGDLIMNLPAILVAANNSFHGKVIIAVSSTVEKGLLEYLLGKVAKNGQNLSVMALGKCPVKRMLNGLRLIFSINAGSYTVFSTYFNEKNIWTKFFIVLVRRQRIIGNFVAWAEGMFSVMAGCGDKAEHKTDLTLKLLARANLIDKPRLSWWTTNKFGGKVAGELLGIEFETPKKSQIIFWPGSSPGESYKRWPPLNYAGLADRIIADFEHMTVVVPLSKGEDGIGRQILMNARRKDRIRLFYSEDWASLLKLVSESVAVVTACSGGSHLASLTDTRSFIIYGPTDHRKTMAYSNNATPIFADIGCRPCYPRKCFRERKNECMERVTVEQVYRAIYPEIASNFAADGVTG